MYRYWHSRFEKCSRCKSNRFFARDRYGKCPSNHPPNGSAQNFRAVSGFLMRGALACYKSPVTHAQAANFLRQWNEDESWRDIARRLLPTRRWKETGRVASLLSAQAHRKIESDEVLLLLNVREPRPDRRIAFRVSPEEFDAIKQVIDSHPNGRTAWLKEMCGLEK